MASYSLSGSGVQVLTAGTTRLYVVITTRSFPARDGQGNPTNRYDQGLIRPGLDSFYWPTIPIDADQQVIDLPSGATEIGYALLGGGAITVTETTPPPPAGLVFSVDIDGMSVANGTAFTFTYARPDTASANDSVQLVDSGWDIGSWPNFLESSPGPCFTSNCANPAGTTPSASGTCPATVFRDSSFGPPVVCRAVYVDGFTGAVLAQTANNITITD